MRISDWSSDVCSSDLIALEQEARLVADQPPGLIHSSTDHHESAIYRVLDPLASHQAKHEEDDEQCDRQHEQELRDAHEGARRAAEAQYGQHGGDHERNDGQTEIGRASCRERECTYV